MDYFAVLSFFRNFATKLLNKMRHSIKMGLLSVILGVAACQSPHSDFETVNAEEFAKVITTPEVQILDVRTAEEYAEGHIANSLNLDVKQEDFTTLAEKALDKSQTVALYCRSGRRSKMAADLLTKEGYKVVELGGGFNEWKDTQHEFVK